MITNATKITVRIGGDKLGAPSRTTLGQFLAVNAAENEIDPDEIRAALEAGGVYRGCAGQSAFLIARAG